MTEIYRKTSFRVKLQDLGAKMSRFCCRMCAFLHLRCARYINSWLGARAYLCKGSLAPFSAVLMVLLFLKLWNWEDDDIGTKEEDGSFLTEALNFFLGGVSLPMGLFQTFRFGFCVHRWYSDLEISISSGSTEEASIHILIMRFQLERGLVDHGALYRVSWIRY